AIAVLANFSPLIQENISRVLTVVYCLVVAVYILFVFSSSLNPFFIFAELISISLGTVIFEKTKQYVFFASVVALISAIIAISVPLPAFSPVLYILSTISLLFVSIVSIYIRLSLSDKLIFADTVINDASSIVMAADPKGDVIYINKTFTKVLGFSEEEVFGQGWWKVRKVISQDSPNPYDKIKKGQIESTATVLLETKYGTQRWIQWQNSKLSNGVFVGIGTDITERRDYEQRFRQLVENAQDIIYTTDSKGNFDYINDVGATVSGYSKEELLGKNYRELVHEDYRQRVEAFYDQQLKTKSRESYLEFPFNTRGEKIVWVGQSVLFKYDPESGFLKATQAICRDITDRVQAQEVLKQNNNDLNVINQVKESILKSNDLTSTYENILLHLGANSDKSQFFSINIFSKNKNALHTYTLKSKDKEVLRNSFPIKPEWIEIAGSCEKHIINLREDKTETDIYWRLHQPTEIYNSAVIMPIRGNNKVYGFVGFFSVFEHIYQETHTLLVGDISDSLANFFVQYDQRKIIENYSKQLEILNESKAKLLTFTNLSDLYKGIIDLLYEKIDNVYRVSILVHDLEKNQGTLYFKDFESPVIDKKQISTLNVPTIPNHLEGRIYEKENFDTSADLTEEDQLWHERGVKTVISLPVIIDHKLVASVNLLSKIPNNFTEQQKAIIKEINESAATVIEQIRYRDIISARNKDISDNITYAKRIQSALMPSEDLLQTILPQSFLVFSQRDSLGGDFYWFEKRGDNIFLAVGDCTGHGVSGALLTILASDYIKQAVEERQLSDPALILEFLSTSLQGTLNKYKSEDEEILDGLDISFGVFNTSTNLFMFSAAMHNFYLARNNELTEYKGNRKPIGGANVFEDKDHFTTILLTLEKNDVVYFTTDGYIDQFHHKSEKRYGRIRLKQLLLQINDKEMQEQKEIMESEHKKWRGNASQTDDICFMAFKV
ncbi:MAG: PAS domain S-box protein, partial [Bacteroidia bacterium]